MPSGFLRLGDFVNEIATTHLLSMTSREIAKLTGKSHSHVMRDIRAMVDKLEVEPDLDFRYETATYIDSGGVPKKMYELDKDATLTLVTGYDPVSRMRIIKRWQELEQRLRQTPQQVLTEYRAMLRQGAASHYNKLMVEIDALYDETCQGDDDEQTLRIKKNIARASEANFLNRLVLGMDAKDIRYWFRIFDKPIRDSMPEKILDAFEKAEIVDAALLRDRKARKERERAIVSMLGVTFPEVLEYRELLLSECARIESQEPFSLDRDLSQRPNHPSEYKELGPERALLEMLNVKDAVLLSLKEATEELRQRKLEEKLNEMDQQG
jgi:phage regulator Rha-like protein